MNQRLTRHVRPQPADEALARALDWAYAKYGTNWTELLDMLRKQQEAAAARNPEPIIVPPPPKNS